MDKDVVHIYMEYYLTIKKNEIMPLEATWMRLEIIILSQMSERERQIQYDIPSMWNLKYDTNELIYKTKTDSDIENKFMAIEGERGQGRDKLGV